MLNVTVICVGKIKEKYFTDAVNEYKKRLSRFIKLDIIEVPDMKIPDNPSENEKETVLNSEGEKILSKIPQGAYVIAMCIEGTPFSSEELAEKIAEVSITSSRIAFIIGGSLGLSRAVKERANAKISFGKITLPHQLMRVVLCEQIYRAFKINNNENYHK